MKKKCKVAKWLPKEALQIAEKILRKQFEDQTKQDALVSDLLKEVKLN